MDATRMAKVWPMATMPRAVARSTMLLTLLADAKSPRPNSVTNSQAMRKVPASSSQMAGTFGRRARACDRAFGVVRLMSRRRASPGSRRRGGSSGSYVAAVGRLRHDVGLGGAGGYLAGYLTGAHDQDAVAHADD